MNPDTNPATPGNLPAGFTPLVAPIELSSADIPLSLPAKPRLDWLYWAKRLLVCNPFFLCSAALLLFAINRLSLDPSFLAGETPNLLFNFFALQGYELLVIGTALILVYRRVWYDSALLVVLENGLVLVPFMLISQAALIGKELAWLLTVSGGLLAAGRFTSVRRYYPQFNLPNRALLMGAIILAANVALPPIFRPWIEKDVEDWLMPNLVAWYAVLPFFAAGANLLPRPHRYGGSNPERQWLPLFIYGLWTAGSAVHCWCLAHICGLRFGLAWLGPLALVCAWTAWNRLTDFLPNPAPWLKKAILLLTFAAPLCAFHQHHLFVLLCAVNFVAYVVLGIFRTDARGTVRELALATVPLLLAGLPSEWHNFVALRDEATLWILLNVLLYVALLAFRVRQFSMALLGGMAFAIATSWLLGQWSAHAAIQAGLVYALAHSMRWSDSTAPMVRVGRFLFALAWLWDTFLWTRLGGWPEWAFVGSWSLLILTMWGASWWWNGVRGSWVYPITATTALFCGPLTWCQRQSSDGIMALAASLVLFALGFLVAWTKHRWAEGGNIH